jgi:NitT/TauT family transport system substrate-binding protein
MGRVTMMGLRHGARLGRVLGLLLAALLVLPLLAACGDDDDAGSDEPDKVTVGLSFVPNIQFAPFYVAQAKGFYDDAGLEVTFSHHAAASDLFGPLVSGDEDVLMAGGDEVAQARSNNLPLVYVAEVYREYPTGLIVPADSDIQTVADLAGRKVGIPGPFGATYIGLLALLEGAGLTESDVTVESVGFTQAQALLTGQVDAIMGYVNNEPIQLEKQGMATRVFPAADAAPLVSNGLVALEKTLDDDSDMVKAFVAATLKGVDYTNAHPDEAVELSKEFVPSLTEQAQLDDAKLVLAASIPLWQADRPLGAVADGAWQTTIDFLAERGLLPGQTEVKVDDIYTDDYLPGD